MSAPGGKDRANTHPDESTEDTAAPSSLAKDVPNSNGVDLVGTFNAHGEAITEVCWSPDGQTLATASCDQTIRLWDPTTGECEKVLSKHFRPVRSIVWLPSGLEMLSGSDDKTIRRWQLASDRLTTVDEHSEEVLSVACSPDGMWYASASRDRSVRIWSAKSNECISRIQAATADLKQIAWCPIRPELLHPLTVGTVVVRSCSQENEVSRFSTDESPATALCWSPSANHVVIGLENSRIIIFDSASMRRVAILEGHSGTIVWVSFTPDGLLLFSKSSSGQTRIWTTDTWEPLGTIPFTGEDSYSRPSFGPVAQNVFRLATAQDDDKRCQIWQVDTKRILKEYGGSLAPRYANAKVTLVGDTGVGKSGLALVLTGHSFTPTDSTHARKVSMLDYQQLRTEEGRAEIRETLLWDLAGQPGYRLIHQLHLDEISVAIIVFDARSDTDPFAGVRHWGRALRQAEKLDSTSQTKTVKLLVAARSDRGTVGASRSRIQELMTEVNIDGYFETSAKEGWGVAELAAAVKGAIDWTRLPRIISTEVFQLIKGFLLREKQAGRLLSTTGDIFRSLGAAISGSAGIASRVDFETCIGLVQSRGLIKRLSFGNLLLLQPDWLDVYASGMVNAAKSEPDGLGQMVESDAVDGRFRMPDSERVPDRSIEKLLLIATVEELLRREIALRESTNEGVFLVFPTQLTREKADLPDQSGIFAIYRFQGAVLNVYATLVVRLAHSGPFRRAGMWRNAVLFGVRGGGNCGLRFREPEEGTAELELFAQPSVLEQIRLQFEEYVASHLYRRAVKGTVRRTPVFRCNGCGFMVTEQLVTLRRHRGMDWITCPVCESRTELIDWVDRLSTVATAVGSMDKRADEMRDRGAAQAALEGKIAVGDFDLFMAHNSKDRDFVQAVAGQLQNRGIRCWLDSEQVLPGMSFQAEIQKGLGKAKAIAIFVGKEGLGRWQKIELSTAISKCVERGRPVIPVLLPDVQRLPRTFSFLAQFSFVKFGRSADEEQSLDALERGTRRKK